MDADLQRVVAAWPDLPDPIRRAVMALVGTATSSTTTEATTDGDDSGGSGDGVA